MTGAALEALNAAGRSDAQRQAWALEYLHEAQTPDGGLPETPGAGEANVASTAWAVQGLWSVGVNPETWLTHSGARSEEPLGYLASMQQPSGLIRYDESEELNSLWMTAYVTPALAGEQYPIPAPPYDGLPAQPPEEASSGEPGAGGVSTNPGGGVIVGGGGDGAKLFSKPQAASKGHRRGGARQLTRSEHRASAAKRSDPLAHSTAGVPARAAAPVAAAHPRRRAGARPPASAGGLSAAAAAAAGRSAGGAGEGSATVRGVLLDEPLTAFHQALEGAPGLRGAGAGGNESTWLALGVAIAAGVLALLGAQLERRRPGSVL